MTRLARRRHRRDVRTCLGHVGLLVLPLLVVYVALLGTAEAVAGRLALPVEVLVVNVVAAMTSILVVLASYRWFGARRSLRAYGLGVDGRWMCELGVGSAIGVTAAALPFLIGLAGGWLQVADVLDAGEMGLWTGIVLIMLANCCVGLWEELMLRGVFLRMAADGLRRWLSQRRALLGGVLMSATVFGLAHAGQPAEPALILTWVLAGSVFGAVAVRSGSLALPIGAHATFNIVYQVLFVRTDLDGISAVSALLRIDVAPAVTALGFGGLLEASAFLLVGALAFAYLRHRPER